MSSSRNKQPESDPTAIGLVARIFGRVTARELDKALEYQKRYPTMRLGDALIACGAMSAAERDSIIQRQKQVRTKPQTKDISRIMDFAAEQARHTGEKIAGLCDDIGNLLLRIRELEERR